MSNQILKHTLKAGVFTAALTLSTLTMTGAAQASWWNPFSWWDEPAVTTPNITDGYAEDFDKRKFLNNRLKEYLRSQGENDSETITDEEYEAFYPDLQSWSPDNGAFITQPSWKKEIDLDWEEYNPIKIQNTVLINNDHLQITQVSSKAQSSHEEKNNTSSKLGQYLNSHESFLQEYPSHKGRPQNYIILAQSGRRTAGLFQMWVQYRDSNIAGLNSQSRHFRRLSRLRDPSLPLPTFMSPRATTISGARNERNANADVFARATNNQSSRDSGLPSYNTLVGLCKNTIFQAHHLNQNAAYRGVIPKGQGISIAMRGDVFKEPNAPHTNFHRRMEQFWNLYRPNGQYFNTTPTNAQYGAAVRESLIAAGYSRSNAERISNLAKQQREAYGLRENLRVPRIPGRTNYARQR